MRLINKRFGSILITYISPIIKLKELGKEYTFQILKNRKDHPFE
jgi:hypothetical protein